VNLKLNVATNIYGKLKHALMQFVKLYIMNICMGFSMLDNTLKWVYFFKNNN